MHGDWPDAADHTAVSEPVTDGSETVECTDKLCSGEAAFALWMGEKFSRVHHPPEARNLDDGDLAPYVCEACLPRYERRHGKHGEFVRPEERLVTDGGTVTVDTTPETATDDLRAVAADCTKFQVRLLAILAEEARYGLAVKRALEAYYGEEINHGRLYPNLDQLVERGLVAKRALDKRTNEYAITDDGRDVLAYEVAWLARHADVTLAADDTPTGSYLPAETAEEVRE